jgi:hypothetical protein
MQWSKEEGDFLLRLLHKDFPGGLSLDENRKSWKEIEDCLNEAVYFGIIIAPEYLMKTPYADITTEK